MNLHENHPPEELNRFSGLGRKFGFAPNMDFSNYMWSGKYALPGLAIDNSDFTYGLSFVNCNLENFWFDGKPAIFNLAFGGKPTFNKKYSVFLMGARLVGSYENIVATFSDCKVFYDSRTIAYTGGEYPSNWVDIRTLVADDEVYYESKNVWSNEELHRLLCRSLGIWKPEDEEGQNQGYRVWLKQKFFKRKLNSIEDKQDLLLIEQKKTLEAVLLQNEKNAISPQLRSVFMGGTTAVMLGSTGLFVLPSLSGATLLYGVALLGTVSMLIFDLSKKGLKGGVNFHGQKTFKELAEEYFEALKQPRNYRKQKPVVIRDSSYQSVFLLLKLRKEIEKFQITWADKLIKTPLNLSLEGIKQSLDYLHSNEKRWFDEVETRHTVFAIVEDHMPENITLIEEWMIPLVFAENGFSSEAQETAQELFAANMKIIDMKLKDIIAGLLNTNLNKLKIANSFLSSSFSELEGNLSLKKPSDEPTNSSFSG